MLTLERLMSVLSYDKDTGIFTWVEPIGRRSVVGKTAGSDNGQGYLVISIDKKRYRAHRLAWFYVYGYMPENQLDHINRIKDDNRIDNLREIGQTCSNRNRGIGVNNNSGIKGVGYLKDSRKWRVVIKIDNKTYSLGRHKDFGEAACARLAAEQCLGWHGCDSDSPAYRYVIEEIQKR